MTYPVDDWPVASPPRGDLTRWRCIECRALVPADEVSRFSHSVRSPNVVERIHLRADRSATPWRAVRCGPVVQVWEYECSGCELLIEAFVWDLVPVFHITRTPGGGAEVCGRYEANGVA